MDDELPLAAQAVKSVKSASLSVCLCAEVSETDCIQKDDLWRAAGGCPSSPFRESTSFTPFAGSWQLCGRGAAAIGHIHSQPPLSSPLSSIPHWQTDRQTRSNLMSTLKGHLIWAALQLLLSLGVAMCVDAPQRWAPFEQRMIASIQFLNYRSDFL